MDQFSAHLDRGWDLAQRGDSRGAELSARRALELDNQSPEAFNLLGYAAALQGDFDDAVEHYGQAIALDDTYLEAMLNAAEVYIHPLGEFDAAIRMCDQAIELAENADELVDALLLKFDALLGKNDTSAATALCERFPTGPLENKNHVFLVGRAFFEIGNLDRATPLIEEATQAAPDNPEAWYYLGLVREERNDFHGATQAFLRSRDLDLMIPPPPGRCPRRRLRSLLSTASRALPNHFAPSFVPTSSTCPTCPARKWWPMAWIPRALLLLDGITANADGSSPSARLFIYQRNVERLAGTVDGVEPELRTALEREILATFLEPNEDDQVDPHSLN